MTLCVHNPDELVAAIPHLLGEFAPTYRKVIFANVSTVFTAAVDDGLISKNPCKAPSVRRPRSDLTKVIPWTRERVLAVRDEIPERYQLVVWLGAGLGLRQGEIFALSPDAIDFEVGEVHVRRQVKLFGGNAQVFGLPKGRKVRKVPLPDVVMEAITAYMTAYPPREVTLPWNVLDGKPTTVELLLTSREKKALGRNYFNTFIWRTRVEACRGTRRTRERMPRAQALLRQHRAPRGRNHQGSERVPRPRRPGLHAQDLHPSHGGQRQSDQAGN